jgi:peptidoglycan L-alanyl-D-glutamate endopeptidase CwlK
MNDKKFQNLFVVHPILLDFFLDIKKISNKAKIVSAYRSFETQNYLYSFGRTLKNKSIVTYAKGGESPHNFGLAIDIENRPSEPEIRELLKKYNNITWGKDFKRFNDSPHFELTNWKVLSKSRLELLKDYV